MNETLREQLRHLRLTRLAGCWEEDLKEAARRNMSHATFLAHVVEQEYRQKHDHAHKQRLNRARLPEVWTLETYPFARQPKLQRKAVQALHDTLDFIPRGQNVIWLGGTGCGKTGLATSFLVQAIQKGYRARYVFFAELIGELYRAIADHSEALVLKKHRCPNQRGSEPSTRPRPGPGVASRASKNRGFKTPSRAAETSQNG